ncbi:putative glycerol-3-phosphate transporter 5 [Prunus persica]|uniref:putative glycerol-3-phosphate transporter 5 n=1 Tax=Prunus persica TaxID=3760 RepID=UPI0009AB344B|nr:putative glycerol-3-phosphate transporter 5 [Prunus persica]
MGIWSSHTSVGNIIDSVVASGVLEFGWGWSFVVPGVLVILVGILVFLFLPVNPEDLGFESRVKEIQMNMEVNGIENLEGKVESDEAGLLGTENVDVDTSADTLAAIGFWEAWRLPGVAPFALCLFFSKLVSYTFLYWLPFYVRHTAGLISDTIEARAVTSITFLLLSVPALVFYWVYGSLSMVANILLMFLSGLLVNGPYSLITTAVAADLGT